MSVERMETAEDTTYSIPDLAVLIDNLKAADLDGRLASTRLIGIIASALGQERSKSEFLPFLRECIDEEDEVSLSLAEQLPSLVPIIGGYQESHALLPIFEDLLGSEEGLVRDKACEGLSSIISNMNQEQLLSFVLPLIIRLTADHRFACRSSACLLYAGAIAQLSDATQKNQLIMTFSKLCADRSPMVRRAAAKSLKDLAVACDFRLCGSDLLPLFLKLAEDPQDSVRLLAVAALPQFSKLESSQNGGSVLSTFCSAARDSSWRVRYMVADVIADFQQSVSKKVVDSQVTEVFATLLSDSESEVRSCAAEKILPFSLNLGDSAKEIVVHRIIPHATNLAQDETEHVRSAVAKVIMCISSVLGKKDTIEYLLPIFLKLLKDTSSDVRLNIICNLEEVNQVIGIDHLSQALLPAIKDLAESEQWRVRLAIIKYVPLVAKQLGMSFFNQELMPLCLLWLKDRVFAVREASVKNLTLLLKLFPMEWAMTFFIPQVMQLASEKNFVHRLTCLFAIREIAPLCDPKTARLLLVPAVCSLKDDKIPNIRLNVSQTCHALLSCTDGDTSEKILRPLLEQLVQDQDSDVRYYAERALTEYESFA